MINSKCEWKNLLLYIYVVCSSEFVAMLRIEMCECAWYWLWTISARFNTQFIVIFFFRRNGTICNTPGNKWRHKQPIITCPSFFDNRGVNLYMKACQLMTNCLRSWGVCCLHLEGLCSFKTFWTTSTSVATDVWRLTSFPRTGRKFPLSIFSFPSSGPRWHSD